ncbi:hypothetical protein CTKZ_02290 [Cellulomonas algicola]|uniref:Uncharacterized protein n=1 Tax=Cellulomonas algicola TaxID=2071633 RepID=A0A401UVG3_9CELL|nr:hypothetical protein CTKZ_02290 [Cellulomonas algicola]
MQLGDGAAHPERLAQRLLRADLQVRHGSTVPDTPTGREHYAWHADPSVAPHTRRAPDVCTLWA